MKKKYLRPDTKMFKVKAEGIMNLASVNDEVGDQVQLSKEVNFDEFEDEEDLSSGSVWD